MRRLIEDIARLTVLHGAPGVHHQHFIADPCHHPKVVGDHDNGRVEFAFKLIQQRHDLRLHGDVQGSGRFIRNQQPGPAQQRHGNHHALTHAPGELVREHFHALTRFRHFYRVEHLHRLFKRFGFTQPFMQHQDFH